MMAFEVENTADKFCCGGGIYARDGAGGQVRGIENINWGPEKVDLVIRNWSGPAAQPYLVFLSTHTHRGHMCLSLSSRGGGKGGDEVSSRSVPIKVRGRGSRVVNLDDSFVLTGQGAGGIDLTGK